MLSGSERLYYNLYLDPGRSTVWGDGTGGTGQYSVSKTKNDWLNLNIPVYGRVPPAQDVAPGSYSDLIVVTVNW
jgi:spore coat protein U-like protein